MGKSSSAPYKLNILNIDQIKEKRTGRFLMHMTGIQWKKAIGNNVFKDFDVKDEPKF
jgi:hypothetical protein